MQDNATGRGPELFFALVYPVGTDADLVFSVLAEALADLNYSAQEIHIIELLTGQPTRYVFDRYSNRMDSGNAFRKEFGSIDGSQDAFALYSAAAILSQRKQRFPEGRLLERVLQRHAYVIRSLKRPEEVETLRKIYGDAFVLIAAHSPRKARRDRLTWEIAKSDSSTAITGSHRPEAESLISRDEREAGDDFGQRVSDTFPMADVFIDAEDPQSAKKSIERFLSLLFGYQFVTPSRDEYGMFHAQGAALRSADLSRQVGAAIANKDGEIVAIGTNEVPKGGGGLYWDGDAEDRRDFTLRSDVSTEVKKKGLAQLLDVLVRAGVLWERPTANLIDAVWPDLEGTELMNVGEFGRAVHAEMAALVDAAKRGHSVDKCILYTTTFPCTVCARHIVSSGIQRVVFNEPYAKSLAEFLHLDSAAIEEPAGPNQVAFERFVGLAPHLYVTLFRMPSKDWRKTRGGDVRRWERETAQPRLYGEPRLYLPRELEALQLLVERVGEARLGEVGE